MPDTKISALSELAAGNVAASDAIPIVDVSDTAQGAGGSTKKVLVGSLPAPAGVGAELQYRAGALTFGAVANVTRTVNGNVALTAQSTPGSLADGELHQGTQKALACYINGVNHRFVGCLFTQTADATVANTTTETTVTGSGVGTLTLPANFLIAGKTIRIEAAGVYSTSGTAGNLQIRLKLGSTAILDTGATALSNSISGRSWRFSAVVTCRSVGTPGAVQATGYHARAAGGTTTTPVDMKNASTTSVDTTASLLLDLTGAFSSASTSNTITCQTFTAEVLN